MRRGIALGLLLTAALPQPVLAVQNSSVVAAPAASAHPWLSLAELRARYQDRASRYLTVGGIQVHYKDEGRGRPILLVHGSSSTMKTWDALVPTLRRAGYRVIRYDVPGMGLSDDVPDTMLGSIAPADVAAALLDQLKIQRTVVVGVSSGGTLGSFLAASRPDLVAQLVITNAPSDPVDTSHLVPTPAWAAAQARAKASGFQDADFWSQFLSYFAGNAQRIDEPTRRHFYDFNRRTPHRNAIGMIAKVADAPKARAAIARVRAPTLLIWGGSDALLPTSAGRTLRDYLTGTDAAIVYMPDVGHFPPIETPDRFARIMLGWLEAAVPEP